MVSIEFSCSAGTIQLYQTAVDIGQPRYAADESALFQIFTTAGPVSDVRLVREGSDGYSCFALLGAFQAELADITSSLFVLQ